MENITTIMYNNTCTVYNNVHTYNTLHSNTLNNMTKCISINTQYTIGYHQSNCTNSTTVCAVYVQVSGYSTCWFGYFRILNMLVWIFQDTHAK